MSWFTNFLGSQIGQKVIMSLTGLFLIIFLVVHLSGNLQLLNDDGGRSFNTYAYFMTHNPVIVAISLLLYAFILLHAIQGIVIKLKNRRARNKGYRLPYTANNSWASRSMALLGILIFAFLLLHMGDFWYKMKFGELPMVTYEGSDHPVKDIYSRVDIAFEQWWLVAAYLLGLVALAFHLWHGFQSAFQTLGLNHPKYMPAVRAIGKLYAIVIPVGFALLPLYFFLMQ